MTAKLKIEKGGMQGIQYKKGLFLGRGFEGLIPTLPSLENKDN
jgi:hypothetical protein